MVRNLKNLEPTLGALADVGPDLDAAIAYAPTFPFTQGFIDRYVRGDYINGYFIIDLTNAGLRKSILLGTHWGRLGAESVPAPGDPEYLQFKYGAPPGAPGGVVGARAVGEPMRGVNGRLGHLGCRRRTRDPARSAHAGAAQPAVGRLTAVRGTRRHRYRRWSRA